MTIKNRVIAAMTAVVCSTMITVPALAVDSPAHATIGTIADYTGSWRTPESLCSLVVIDQDYALTAAHCVKEEYVDEPEQHRIRIGAKGYLYAQYEEAVVHPYADLAVVKISSPMTLPTAELPNGMIPVPGERGHVIGWGARGDNDSSAYADAQLTGFVNDSDEDGEGPMINLNVSEQARVVPGDSGGAFIIDDTVIGITSSVYTDKEGEYLPSYKAVPVALYTEWIGEVTGIDTSVTPVVRTILDRVNNRTEIMESDEIVLTRLPARAGLPKTTLVKVKDDTGGDVTVDAAIVSRHLGMSLPGVFSAGR